jgi:hypothetical protein
MTDVLRFVFLELGRFKKHIWELDTTFDKWMYLLIHMHEMVEIPQIFRTPEFERLFLLSKINNFTPEEYSEYEKSLKHMPTTTVGFLVIFMLMTVLVDT